MKSKLLAWLCCPSDSGQLELHATAEDEGEIESGKLVCRKCGAEFPIVEGIPRFVPLDNYASSFGKQWNRYSAVQLDSNNRTSFSHDRFYSITEWEPSQLKDCLVLDVGCGAGRFAEVALESGAEVIGIDLSSAVNAAHRNLRTHDRFHCLQASIFNLPFADQTFDYVYCIGVIQHTPEPQRSVLSILRKIKQGGKIGLWIYELDWKAFVGTVGFKYLLRPLTQHWNFERTQGFATALEKMFWPVTRWGRHRGLVGRIAMRLLPVSSAHLEGLPLSDEHFREWVRLDTLDMYSPAHDHPQTFATVKGWLEDAGFEVDPRHSHGGISITARRLR